MLAEEAGVPPLKGHNGPIVAAAISRDGRRVITAGDTTVRLWNTRAFADPAIMLQSNSVRSVSYDAAGHRVLTANADGSAQLWNAETGKLESNVNRKVSDSSVLDSGVTRIRAGAGGAREVTLRGAVSQDFAPVVSSDGRRLVVVYGNDHDLHLVDATSGSDIALLKGHQGKITSAAFRPDGRLVVTTDQQGVAILWDGATGELLATFEKFETASHASAFSPDSKILAIAAGPSAYLFNAETRTAGKVLRGHEREITALAFSPDGTRILTGSRDNLAALWDVASGKPLAYYRGHSGPIIQAAYRRDGRQVATTSEDGTARLWPVDLFSAVERLRPRELTAEERRRYGLDQVESTSDDAPKVAISPAPGTPIGRAVPSPHRQLPRSRRREPPLCGKWSTDVRLLAASGRRRPAGPDCGFSCNAALRVRQPRDSRHRNHRPMPSTAR